MDDWRKCNEISLAEQEYFYSHVNMDDITVEITRTQKEFAKILK